jgi:hypothetical protein
VRQLDDDGIIDCVVSLCLGAHRTRSMYRYYHTTAAGCQSLVASLEPWSLVVREGVDVMGGCMAGSGGRGGEGSKVVCSSLHNSRSRLIHVHDAQR